MHDVSLGQSIRDYLTGEDIEQTTYEDLRQAMARLLVEEKGYPREQLRPRVAVCFPIDGKNYTRIVDLAAFDASGSPLLLLLFCPGVVSTYQREALAAARLFPEGPAPLIVVTDSKDAMLLDVASGNCLGQGMQAIPAWERLQEKAAEAGRMELAPARLEAERRILYAYSESLYDCCDGAACAVAAKGGRWGGES